jgi:uncharacterized protein YceK
MAFFQNAEKFRPRVVVVLTFFLTLTGCGTVRRLVGPTSTASLAGASVTAAGSFAAPAELIRTATRSTVTLPAGAVVTIGAPATDSTPAQALTSTLPAPAELVTTTETTTARTAQPVTPPTPAQVAAADSFRYYVLAGLGLVALAAVAAYSQHYLAAAKLGVAGLVLPIVAHFVAAHAAVIVAAVLVGAALAAVALYYSHVRPAQVAAALRQPAP